MGVSSSHPFFLTEEPQAPSESFIEETHLCGEDLGKKVSAGYRTDIPKKKWTAKIQSTLPKTPCEGVSLLRFQLMLERRQLTKCLERDK